MADEVNNNGRITMAILGQKLDQLIRDVAEIKTCYKIDHDILTTIVAQVKQNKEDIEELDTRLDNVDNARKWEGRLEALLTAILAAIGIAKP